MDSNPAVLASAKILVHEKINLRKVVAPSPSEMRNQLVLAQLAIYVNPKLMKKWLTKGYPTNVTLTNVLEGNIKLIRYVYICVNILIY